MKKTRSRPSSESSVHGIIVCGEASESEEEELYNISFTEEEGFTNIDPSYPKRETGSLQPISPKKDSHHNRSLLHQKLYEANITFCKNIGAKFQDPLSDNANKISKLRSRLGPIYTQTAAANLASQKSKWNVQAVLDQLTNIDHSHLPCTRPFKN